MFLLAEAPGLPESTGWRKPNIGFLKCNCDATIFGVEGVTAMGCVKGLSWCCFGVFCN